MYDKFNWNLNDVNYKNEDLKENQDLQEYFKNRRQQMKTIDEKLNVGDVVILKTTHDEVTISDVDYVGADYAGFANDESSKLLFGQEDIEMVKYRTVSKKL